jgi:hypothetical protein
MSWILWLLMLMFGVGSFFGVSESPEAEVGVGSAEAPALSATQPTEATPKDGFADPFPDDLGVPVTNRQIQDRFVSRWPLPSCGFVDLATDAGDEGWRCLQAAVGGKDGAELVVLDFDEQPMTTTTYRVNPDGPMEVFVDTSEVPGTKPTWEYRQCQPSKDIRTEPCAS